MEELLVRKKLPSKHASWNNLSPLFSLGVVNVTDVKSSNRILKSGIKLVYKGLNR